jgi:hypothetical protein
MLMASPQGGGAGCLGKPTTNVKNINSGPLGGSAKGLRAPAINEKNVDGRHSGGGGGDGGSGAPTTQLEDIDGGPPWEVVSKVQERPPSTQKTLTAGPLGGDAGGSGALTINGKNIIDGRPAGVRCQRSGSTHHQCKKRRRRAPWEAVPEVQERLP